MAAPRIPAETERSESWRLLEKVAALLAAPELRLRLGELAFLVGRGGLLSRRVDVAIRADRWWCGMLWPSRTGSAYHGGAQRGIARR